LYLIKLHPVDCSQKSPSRVEATSNLSKVHKEELHNLYSLPNIVLVIQSRDKMGGYVALIEEIRNSYNILVPKPEGKEPLGRPSLAEMGYEGVG
jgi:hypothetical protein